MPIFRYSAKDLNGEVASGTYDVLDEKHVVRMLRQRGFYPLKVEKVESSKDISEFGFFNKVTLKDTSLFCRQFATLLTAGLPLLRILDLLAEQNSNIKLRKDILGVAEEIRTGKSLSDSMMNRKCFPQLLVNMIAAAEMGGALERILHAMALHYEKEQKVIQKVKNAMTYPVIILVVTTAVVYFLLTAVVPTFIGMFEGMGVALPLPTRILLGLSAFTSSYGLFIIVGMVFAALLFKSTVSHGEGRYKWHSFLIKTPLIGTMIILVLSSRFTSTMAMLLTSGVQLIEALEMTKKILDNAYAERGLTQVQEKLRLGGGLWGPLEQLKLFPALVINMVRVGEESGNLDDVLSNTARFYEEETESFMLRMTTLLEPAMILVLGGVVAFVVLSIVLPMFDMMGMIG